VHVLLMRPHTLMRCDRDAGCHLLTVRLPCCMMHGLYTDVEFGRIQARDLLQHLWTGPISNAPVEIIQVGLCGNLTCCCLTASMQLSAFKQPAFALHLHLSAVLLFSCGVLHCGFCFSCVLSCCNDKRTAMGMCLSSLTST
jgi:hypothetical protein